jgi:hypothetical protein
MLIFRCKNISPLEALLLDKAIIVEAIPTLVFDTAIKLKVILKIVQQLIHQ